MDYRILNVRAYVIIIVRACTHGGWAHRQRVSTTFFFDSEKLTNMYCTPDGIRNSVLWILSPMLYQVSHPVTPMRASFTFSGTYPRIPRGGNRRSDPGEGHYRIIARPDNCTFPGRMRDLKRWGYSCEHRIIPCNLDPTASRICVFEKQWH